MIMVIDPQNAGIAGNMVIGAMIDLGVNQEEVQDIMEYYASFFGEINVDIRQDPEIRDYSHLRGCGVSG